MAMTIALGVVCSDGVVLGVDLQYTQDATKTPGQKMFWICPGRPYSILIAASGNPDSAKEVVVIAEDLILTKYPDVIPTVKQIKHCIQSALRKVYFGHIDLAPVDERPDLACDLLVAIRIGNEVLLFYTNRTLVVKERDTKCLGIGLYFSTYALASLLPLSPSVELAARVVAYTIGMAKNYVEGVGHGSDIHMLYWDGRHDSLSKPEREEIELTFTTLMNHMQHLICCADVDSVPEGGTALRLGWLSNDIEELRSLQRKRRELRKRWLSDSTEKSDPRSTTPDQSRPQPSPESPGGFGES